MAKDHRLMDDIGADMPMRVIVNITAAHAYGMYGNSCIQGTNDEGYVDISQAELAFSLKNKCLHFQFPTAPFS